MANGIHKPILFDRQKINHANIIYIILVDLYEA